jgi:DNA processing protein
MGLEEGKSYHAIQEALQGNYRAIEALFKEHRSWRAAWEHIRHEYRIDREKLWDDLAAANIKLILANDSGFPRLLCEMPWQPFGIYVRGAPLDDRPHIAIVGTRKAAMYGKKIASSFAEALAGQGITLVSGLALGIDAVVHAGALKAGGRTVAVVGNGLDQIYPKENERLAQEILAAGGTIVSEYRPGTPPLPHRFIERNRIIAGLSRGTVVVEAPKSSGALATARFALEQNREVFVVPGTIDNPNFVGSHELLKSGAALVTSVDDILVALNIAPETPREQQHVPLDEKEQIIINVLSREGELSPDKIAEQTSLGISPIIQTLGFLTAKGLVKEENGRFSRSA